LTPITATSTNVVTDFDEKAVAFIQLRMVPPVAYRAMAILHIAMFDALNSIEPRYRPYYAQFPATQDTSKDAAVAAAAGAVLVSLLPEIASDIQASLQSYLATIPDSEAKSNGITVGEAVAAKTLEARASDGSSAPDAYRPVTRPGLYTPTALTVTPQWPDLTPFAMTGPSQFRPKPPIALESEEWAKEYNEIKELGAKNSNKRSPQQTEDARFWLLTGPLSTHPLSRQIVIRKEMSVIDSARFMTVTTAAEADAAIAVMDAKRLRGAKLIRSPPARVKAGAVGDSLSWRAILRLAPSASGCAHCRDCCRKGNVPRLGMHHVASKGSGQ
jgi:hypothetical protein